MRPVNWQLPICQFAGELHRHLHNTRVVSNLHPVNPTLKYKEQRSFHPQAGLLLIGFVSTGWFAVDWKPASVFDQNRHEDEFSSNLK
jgi:hypothetical protein